MPLDITASSLAGISAADRRPLFLGCSGGGGHISAILAIMAEMLRLGQLTEANVLQYIQEAHQSVNVDDLHFSQINTYDQQQQIRKGSQLFHEYAIGSYVIRKAVSLSNEIPILPSWQELEAEINKLDVNSNQAISKRLNALIDNGAYDANDEEIKRLRHAGLIKHDASKDPAYSFTLEKWKVDDNNFAALQDSGYIVQDVDSNPTTYSFNWQDDTLKNKLFWQRPYVDVLVDLYKGGAEGAAVWNVLQRKDEVPQLAKLIGQQSNSDYDNFQDVHAKFLKLLQDAAKNGKPYSEVISTQAMSLAALCQAVIDYNLWLGANAYNEDDFPRIKVQQYMTDLPTTGAVHFFNSLQGLSLERRAVMHLHAVNLKDDIAQHFQLKDFAGLHNIDPKKNPMVNPAFRDPKALVFAEKQTDIKLADYMEWSKAHNIYVQDQSKAKVDGKFQLDPAIIIDANKKVATVMLGSQAGNDSLAYARKLARKGYIVFLFAAKNADIKNAITDGSCNVQFHEQSFTNKNNFEGGIPGGIVHVLGYQEHKVMAPIMCRSNVVIVRGGGLSVMEQMGVPHNPEQTVFIHHKEPKLGEDLCSGISWEDENVNMVISYLAGDGIDVKAYKTSTTRFNLAMKLAALDHVDVEKEGGYTKFIDKLLDIIRTTEWEVKGFLGGKTVTLPAKDNSRNATPIKLPTTLAEIVDNINTVRNNKSSLGDALYKGNTNQKNLADKTIYEQIKITIAPTLAKTHPKKRGLATRQMYDIFKQEKAPLSNNDNPQPMSMNT